MNGVSSFMGNLKIKGKSLDQFLADKTLLEELSKRYVPDLRKWVPFSASAVTDFDYEALLSYVRKEVFHHLLRVLEVASRDQDERVPVYIGFVVEGADTTFFSNSEGICSAACMLPRTVVRQILLEVGEAMAQEPSINLPGGLTLLRNENSDRLALAPVWFIVRELA